MKIGSTLVFALLTLISLSGFSQQVSWGAVQMDDINLHHCQFITKNPNNCLVMRCDYTAEIRAFNNFGIFKLDRYDKSLNQVLSVTLSPKMEKQELRTEFGLDMKGNLFIVSSRGDHKAKRAYYYYQKLDGKTLQLQGAPVQIAEGNHNQFTDPSYCRYDISEDTMHVLLVTLNIGGPKSNEFGVYVMDKDMKVELSKSIILPVPANGSSLRRAYLDNQGNTYLVVASGSEDAKAQSSKAVQVFCVKKKTGEVVKLPIQAEGGTITEVIMDYDLEQRPVFVGFYSNGDPEISNGYVFYRLNKETLAVEASTSQPFPSDFLRQSMKDSQLDKGKGDVTLGLDSYQLHSLVRMANGKTLLLAERSITRMGSQSVLYYDLEIAVMLISEKGDLVWAKKIPKRQVCNGNNWYSSFAVMRGNDEVFLLYNDAKENVDKSLETATAKYEMANSSGVVVKATISANGEITRKVLFSNAEIKTMSLPAWGCQSNSKQMLLYAKEFRKYMYGLVSF